MKAVLIDTNIISFIFKKDSRAKSYEPHLKGKIPTTSFMTVAELYQWANIRNWGDKRKQQMEDELKKYIVLSYDLMLRAAHQKRPEICHCEPPDAVKQSPKLYSAAGLLLPALRDRNDKTGAFSLPA